MSAHAHVYRFADIRVDAAAARVFRGDRPIALEPKAFDVLKFLLENPGRLVEKQELLDAVWGDTVVTENAMTRVVAHLRKSLGDHAREALFIETVPTRGYRFIAEVSTEDGYAAPREQPATPPSRGVALLALLAGIVLGVGSFLLLRSGADSHRAPRQLALPLLGPTLDAGWSPVFDLSPAGDELVFVGRESTAARTKLYLRSLESESLRSLSGTEDASAPVFSPDGAWVAFFREERLMRVAVSGGAVETILASRNNWPMKTVAEWLDRESIGLLYAGPSGIQLERVTLRGERSLLWRAAIGPQEYVSWMDLVAGTKVILSTRTGPNPEDSRIEVLDFASGARRRIGSGHHGRHSETGHLVYVTNGTLFAVPIDWKRLEPEGPPVVLAEGVLSDPLTGTAQFAFSAEGTLAYLPPLRSANLALAWADRGGAITVERSAPFRFYGPVLSPDARRVAFRNMASREARALWLMEVATGEARRLPIEGNPVSFVWHPDGREVAFAWDRDGAFNLYTERLEGPGEPVRLTESPRRQFPKSFSPDGRLLAYEEEAELEGERDIWLVRVEDGEAKECVPLLRTPFDEKEPSFSPDGRFLAFQTNASGRTEVEVYSMASGKRWQVSTGGGREPLWTRGGREIVYRSGNQMFAVQISTDGDVEISYPRPLFATDFVSPGHRNYDVTPDGERFLGVRVEGLEPYDSVPILLDWPRKLGR